MFRTTLLMGMINTVLNHFLGWEIFVNLFVQQWFAPAAPLFEVLSEHFSPGKLWHVAVPFVGLFSDSLLKALVYTLSLLNVQTSVLKWFISATRPQWWQREHGASYNNTIKLEQFHLSCESSSGFPSHHVVAFNVFVLLVTSYSLKCAFHSYHLKSNLWTPIYHAIVTLTILPMWLSRLYYGTIFLHQCIFATVLVSMVLCSLEKYKNKLMSVARAKALVAILAVVSVLYAGYVIMLYLDMDPHWSVRMAFKWCPDPTFLRHESSPFFVLARDLGYLAGVALSAPLKKVPASNCSLNKRFTIMVIIEVINYNLRAYTPKDNGRIAFLGFEFARCTFHSYALLNAFGMNVLKNTN